MLLIFALSAQTHSARLYPPPEGRGFTLGLDKNFAVHFPFLDLVFGTCHHPGKLWPSKYGVDEKLIATYWGQLIQPFVACWKVFKGK